MKAVRVLLLQVMNDSFSVNGTLTTVLNRRRRGRERGSQSENGGLEKEDTW